MSQLTDEDMQKRRVIFLEATQGKTLLATLKAGNDVYDPVLDNPAIIEKRLMQILHFRHYAKMYEFAFHDWGTEGLEQTYIEVANEALELHLLLHHDVFNETLLSLLKILAELTGQNPLRIHAAKMVILNDMWIDAKLVI